MIYAYYILNKLDWYEYKQSVLFMKTKIQANIRLKQKIQIFMTIIISLVGMMRTHFLEVLLFSQSLYKYRHSILQTSIYENINVLKIHEHKSMIKDNRANLDQVLVKSMFPHYGSITSPSVCLF